LFIGHGIIGTTDWSFVVQLPDIALGSVERFEIYMNTHLHTHSFYISFLSLSVSCVKQTLYCLGYMAAYKQRLGGRTDGCATFYKRKKFNCCNSIPIDFFVNGCSVLDRPNVALLMLLEPVVDSRRTWSSSTCVCVANTHLLFNPGRGDVKLAQLMFLFAAIDEMAGMTAEPCPKYHPVILCGDLNLEPFSILYDFIVDGSLHFEGLPMKAVSGQKHDHSGHRLRLQHFLPPQVDVTDFAQFFEITEHRRNASRRRHRWRSYDESFFSGTVHHSLNLASAYDDGRPRALTAWLGDSSRSAHVDYIFYSAEQQNPAKVRSGTLSTRRMAEGVLTLSHVLQLPTREEVYHSGGLPNGKESSDHLMLMAHFILTT